MTVVNSPRLRAELAGPSQLGDGGEVQMTLSNVGSVADVYRLTAETEFHRRAQADPALVRLEPGTSRQVRVAADAPVAVRVYSQVSGQRVAEAYLSH
jgi:hypothetical protein